MLDMFFTHFFTHIFCTPLKNYSLCHQYQPSITHITTIKFQLVTNFGPLSFALGRGLLKREMLGTETCETYFQSDKTKPTWEQQCRGWQRCSTRRWWSLSSSFGLASRREAPERCGCLYFTHACGSDAISTGNVNRWHLLRYHNYCFTIFIYYSNMMNVENWKRFHQLLKCLLRGQFFRCRFSRLVKTNDLKTQNHQI